jgi:hypothetical protein
LATLFDQQAPVFHQGLMFDIEVTNPNGITITGFGVYGQATVLGMWVGHAPGGFAGHETGGSAWRVQGFEWQNAGAQLNPQFLMRPAPGTAYSYPVYLAPGRHGIWLVDSTANGQPRLRATVGTTAYANADLIVHAGVASSPLGGPVLGPRVWNGVVYYQTCDSGGIGGYGDVARGCSSAQAFEPLADAFPRLGQTAQLPVSGLGGGGLGAIVLGLAETQLPLAALGAPSCTLFVQPDVVSLVVGDLAGGAVLPLTVPNAPGLLCARFYAQGLAVQFGPTGLVVDALDARTGVIGL